MNTKHEHYDAIVGWAAGETIQYFSRDDNKWFDLLMDPTWAVGAKYRVKPKYPATLMTDSELEAAYKQLSIGYKPLKAVANAAIRHAIDSGQVIIAPKGE